MIIDPVSIPIKKTGTHTIVRYNLGYPTENYGIATIEAGNTYVDVEHGLADVPSYVNIIPRDNLGGRSFWVDNENSSTFRINIDSSDTVDHSFFWYAEV